MKKRFVTGLLAAFLLALLCLPATGIAAGDELLSGGKTYTVEYAAAIDNAFPYMAYEPETGLTDGKTAGTAHNDPAWVQLYRGVEVEITVDLEGVCAVSGFSAGMLQNKTAGILCARYMRILVSEDGESFGLAAEYSDPSKITQPSATRVLHEAKCDTPVRARYVKFVISSDVNTYIDEISVYGSKDASGAATAPEYKEKADIGFPKSENLDGISSICLMYIAAQYTAEELKPYVAYIDKKTDKPTDNMFDSLLFLGMPSTNSPDGFLRQQDMIKFVDNALGVGLNINISALDAAVGELKSELWLGDDYQYPIFLAVPFPGLYNDAFGEINGQQVSSSNLEERLAIVKWFVDYSSQRFAECNFQNLSLKGMYWFHEVIEYPLSTHEEELMKGFNDYCHQKSLKTIWIPYYCASGFSRAAELGFDAATLQSGHAFYHPATGETDPQCVSDSAAAAKRYGLGMEFEVDSGVDNYFKRFEEYVHVAYREGLMDGGVMMMYQVTKDLYNSASSAASSGRRLYDLTYKYCSGTYSEHTPIIGEVPTVTVKQGEYVRGRFEVTDEDTNVSNIGLDLFECPDGVYVNLDGSGFYEVDAALAEPGTYVVRFSVTDGRSSSEVAEMTVIVEPNENNKSESSPESADGGSSSGGNTTVYIIVAVAVAVAAAAIVFIIIMLKKNKK